MRPHFLPLIRTQRPPTFLIWAPRYTHRSSGVRALFRLCHHLNAHGFSAAIKGSGQPPKGWQTPFYEGAASQSVVIYPEVVMGNPLKAQKIIRWVMNDPGLLGGDTVYPLEEMVFVYDAQKLPIASIAAGETLGPERVIWFGLIDPEAIYPDPSIPKTHSLSFTHKGQALQKKFPLPTGIHTIPLETVAKNMKGLGDNLRRCKTLYSYDHYSNVLREAVISGCEVLVVSQDRDWHDPRTCDCALNIRWDSDLIESYAERFHDHRFVEAFIDEVQKRWSVRSG